MSDNSAAYAKALIAEPRNAKALTPEREGAEAWDAEGKTRTKKNERWPRKLAANR